MAPIDKAYQITNLPKIHWDCKLSGIPESCPHKKSISAWVGNIKPHIESGSNLILWGDYGTGKSACAAIAMKAAIKCGFFGLWLMVDDYLNAKMEDIYYSDTETVDQRCKSVPILVLDELILREKAKEKEIMIEQLLRHRLEARKTTIITTNHNNKYVKANYAGLYSVIKGHYYSIQPSGHDFRAR